MEENLIREGERLDDLEIGGFRLIQSPNAFRFGTDSVLLAHFAAPKKNETVVDLGCGTGAIATLMIAHGENVSVDAVEIQESIADMARRSAMLNGISDRMRVICADMREAWRMLGAGKYSRVVCNPPYHKVGAGFASASESAAIARQEGEISIGEVALAAAKLLKTGGRFCTVFPAARAFELMRAMESASLSPKRIQTVHGVTGRKPKLVLIDAVKQGGAGLEWLEPLILQNEDGSPTAQWNAIYHRS